MAPLGTDLCICVYLQHIFCAEDFLAFTGDYGRFLDLPSKFLILAMIFSAVQFCAVAIGAVSHCVCVALTHSV